MDNAKKELVMSWFIKAKNDLGSAQLLANSSEPFYDTAIYHCQQAAEKALKASLVYNDIIFDKVHNITKLVELCAKNNSEFKNYLEAAEILTPYATAFRYPGEFFELEPDEAQVDEALQLAKEILEFTQKQLPKEFQPQ